MLSEFSIKRTIQIENQNNLKDNVDLIKLLLVEEKKTFLLGTSYEAHPAECAGSHLLFECAKIKAQNAIN